MQVEQIKLYDRKGFWSNLKDAVNQKCRDSALRIRKSHLFQGENKIELICLDKATIMHTCERKSVQLTETFLGTNPNNSESAYFNWCV